MFMLVITPWGKKIGCCAGFYETYQKAMRAYLALSSKQRDKCSAFIAYPPGYHAKPMWYEDGVVETFYRDIGTGCDPDMEKYFEPPLTKMRLKERGKHG